MLCGQLNYFDYIDPLLSDLCKPCITLQCITIVTRYRTGCLMETVQVFTKHSVTINRTGQHWTTLDL